MILPVHHYKILDRYNYNFFNAHDKFIVHKKGGGKNSMGNDYIKYDFEVKSNRIFVGEPHYACMDIHIEDNEALIIFYGHLPKCEHRETTFNAKHMFLWSLIALMKHFPNVQKISLGDDTKIHCEKDVYHLYKYYFLRYGKLYYHLYFNFLPEPFYGTDDYEQFLQEKWNKMSISQDWINNFFIKKIPDKDVPDKLNIMKKFLKPFGKKNEITIQEYLNNFGATTKNENCDIFYYMIDLYFLKNVDIKIPLGYFFEIKNKEKFIEYLENQITQTVEIIK